MSVALRRSRHFFFNSLVSISFPIEFDFWVRLCTHFEAAKVMTFAPVTQHFSRLNTPAVTMKNEGAKKEEGIEKEKMQISHLRKEAGVGLNNTWKQY